MKLKLLLVVMLVGTSFLHAALMAQVTTIPSANPILSRGKPVFTSNGSAPYLVDNDFTGFSANNNALATTAGSWIAINVGAGASKVFVSWVNTGYTWSDVVASTGSCKSGQFINFPVNYVIQTSNNSTNGVDGTWTDKLTVTDNVVTTRGHQIDFGGASWIKMKINSISPSSPTADINEVEVFDISSGVNDLWFFPGTSITANTYKGTPPPNNFADLINQAHPGYNPAMIKGGIPCIKSSDMVGDITKYLAAAGNVKYWAIEMGTNDAWGGSNSLAASFKSNLQTIITACKNAGITAILARTPAADPVVKGWQVHPDFLKAIDDLTTENGLMAGPDLYTWFLNHPSELIDGIHPNATGAASIQKLWADKVSFLYTSSANALPTVSITAPASGSNFIAPASITINATAADTDGSISNVQFYNGTTLLDSDAAAPYSYTWTSVAAGTYSITAKATDNRGGTTSNTVSVTVAGAINIPPTVNVSSPANGAVFTAPASFTVSANATDTDGTITNVQFYNGTALLGSDTTAPYSFSWTSVAAGTYTISVKATDNTGATTGSTPTTVTVNASSTTGDVTITPTDDTDTQTDIAEGTNPVLQISKWSNTILRFDLSSVPANVSAAKLRFYLPNGNIAFLLTVETTSTDSWSEGGTRPSAGSVITTKSVTAATSGTYVEVDLTAHVQSKVSGDKIVSLFLLNDLGTWTSFNSRQSANKPQLVVTTSGATSPVPMHVEAENWTAMSGVQTETTADTGGGLNVGYIDNGDWMDYNLSFAAAGTYTLSLRVAGNASQCQIIDGQTVLSTVNLPGTGAWQTWTTVNTTISVPAGLRTIRIRSNGVPHWNINYFDYSFLTSAGTAAKASARAATSSSGSLLTEGGEDGVTIFPNPANHGNFTIAIRGFEVHEVVTIEISPITGSSVYKQTLTTDEQGQGDVNVTEPSYKPGLYILKIGGLAKKLISRFVIE